MYAALLRAGVFALFAAPFAAIASEVLTPLIDLFGPEAQGTMLKQAVETAASELLLIVLFAVAMEVVYRSVVERRAANGGVR